MKKLVHPFFIILMIVTNMSACKEKQNVDPSERPTETDQGDAVTAVGEPIGTVISKVIGTQGGTISDSSGRLSVVIPAGALKENVNISVQPVTNHAPGGRADAFRLLPHGQLFEKPVTLTFKYDESDLNGTFEEALGICYQNSKNNWLAIGGGSRDTLANTVSIQTSHFSDWAFFAAIDLTPQVEGINPGSDLALLVHYMFKLDEDDLLAPLVEPVESVLQNATGLLDSKYIERWEKQGEGTLQPNGNKAKYIAPNRIPAKNPVEIVVRVKSGKSFGWRFRQKWFFVNFGEIYIDFASTIFLNS